MPHRSVIFVKQAPKFIHLRVQKPKRPAVLIAFQGAPFPKDMMFLGALRSGPPIARRKKAAVARSRAQRPKSIRRSSNCSKCDGASTERTAFEKSRSSPQHSKASTSKTLRRLDRNHSSIPRSLRRILERNPLLEHRTNTTEPFGFRYISTKTKHNYTLAENFKLKLD